MTVLALSRLLTPLRRLGLALLCLAALGSQPAGAADNAEYRLGPGDGIRIQVFQNPDLSLEARVSENGVISYPLLGSLNVSGITLGEAEQRLANALQEGGFVQKPQVTIALTQIRSNQVSILGQVGRPGRYPLDTPNTRVSDAIATAGGILALGSDTVVLSGLRDGQAYRREVDLASVLVSGKPGDDPVVQAGDTLYVRRAPVFYVYGEAQRPGAYRLERDMTVQQALAAAGGLTPRGTEFWLQIHRKNADGKLEKLSAERADIVQTDDVIYVRESLF